MTAESVNEKATLQWMKRSKMLCACKTLCEIRLANPIKAIVAEGPQPPLMERTKGVIEPCSISITLLQCFADMSC